MKNPATVLLVIAVGILGLLAYFQARALRQQRQQTYELTVKLKAAPKNDSLQLQETCAKQAREFLAQFDNRDVVEALNHYNIKLNKCFVETRSFSSTSAERTESNLLDDAFEGKEYGSYILFVPTGKADWQVQPSECWVLLPSGEEKNCQSGDEFDALVKQYME